MTALTTSEAYSLDRMNSNAFKYGLGTRVKALEDNYAAYIALDVASPITGFVSGAGTLSASDTILQAFNKLDGNLQGLTVLTNVLTGFVSGAGTLSSADTILGAIQKLSGDLQNKPVLTNVLTAFSSGAGSLSSADTVLGAFQKLDGNVVSNTARLVILEDGTFSVAGSNAETSSSDVGAISISKLLTNISAAGAQSRTLAAPGVAGQLKIIEMSVHGGDCTLALTNVIGNTTKTATFSAIGQSLVLISVSAAYWALISAGGTAIA